MTPPKDQQHMAALLDQKLDPIISLLEKILKELSWKKSSDMLEQHSMGTRIQKLESLMYRLQNSK